MMKCQDLILCSHFAFGLILGVAAALTGSVPALAQDLPHVAGIVQKVDSSAEKITLKHGPVPNLDMDEMTMAYKAGDKTMLDQVKPGDKVWFTADRVDGHLTVTQIQKVEP